MKKLLSFIIFGLMLTRPDNLGAVFSAPVPDDQIRLTLLLDWVYNTMNENYYEPVSREIFEMFKKSYTAEVLYQANEKNPQTDDFIHLGAGLLVKKLTLGSDRFSNFIPPKKVQEFKEDAYAKRTDLGMKGEMTRRGFELSHVQKHSDAFKEGLRDRDILLKVNGRGVTGMTGEEIDALLEPELGSFSELEVLIEKTGVIRVIRLEGKTYFEETVQMSESTLRDVWVMGITHFNQMTPMDVEESLERTPGSIRHLVVDLRGNQGGPPLAVREIMGIFTPPQDVLFVIARRNQRPLRLDSSMAGYHYDGPITVLVDEHTASAAETLCGVLQKKRLAKLVGRKTSGASYLKSLYDYEDGSSLMLVTSKTFFHDGMLFPIDGIAPDVPVGPETDILQYVLDSLTR